VACAIGTAAELDESTALEDSVNDGFGEVVVVEDSAPVVERLVGGEDDRPPTQVAMVDDLEEDVGGVGAVGEVADFVDDEDMGMGVGVDGIGVRSAAAVKRAS